MRVWVSAHPDLAWAIFVFILGIFGTGVKRWGLPWWMKRRDRAQARADLIEALGKQLLPNGGDSFSDRIKALHDEIMGMRRDLACRDAQLRMLFDRDEDIAYFLCNAQGEAVYLSTAFSRWTGWSVPELLCRNWTKLIPQSERHEIVEAWYETVQQGIDFTRDYHFQDTRFHAFPVHAEAQPVRHEGVVVAYSGTVRRTNEISKS